jgi:hypothetical protein
MQQPPNQPTEQKIKTYQQNWKGLAHVQFAKDADSHDHNYRDSSLLRANVIASTLS